MKKAEMEKNRLEFACQELGIDKELIWGRCRKPEIVAKRWMVACFLYELGCNYNEIGRMINRDHQTATYAIAHASRDAWYVAEELVQKFEQFIAPKIKVPNYVKSRIEEKRVESRCVGTI